MDKLLTYLNSLDIESQAHFAARCQTTLGYLRKACSIKQQLGDGLCLRIGIESKGAVSPEDLRPDIDWQYMRSALACIEDLAQAPANTAQAVTNAVAVQGA
jgi:DNA-binding transcriptional regulator YdaS (Cro superfamily)